MILLLLSASLLSSLAASVRWLEHPGCSHSRASRRQPEPIRDPGLLPHYSRAPRGRVG